MYNDEPTEAIKATDERVGLMQAYVQLDDEIYRMAEEHQRLGERLENAKVKRSELRDRLSDAIGLAPRDAGVKYGGMVK